MLQTLSSLLFTSSQISPFFHCKKTPTFLIEKVWKKITKTLLNVSKFIQVQFLYTAKIEREKPPDIDIFVIIQSCYCWEWTLSGFHYTMSPKSFSIH